MISLVGLEFFWTNCFHNGQHFFRHKKTRTPKKKNTKACSLFFGVKYENENGVIGLQPSWMSMCFFFACRCGANGCDGCAVNRFHFVEMCVVQYPLTHHVAQASAFKVDRRM